MSKALPIILAFLFLVTYVEEAFGQCDIPFPLSTGSTACQDAPLFCSNDDLDGYCTSLGPTGTGPCPPPFCSGCQNFQWFTFIAETPNLSLLFTPSNCQGSGLQVHMYSTSDCTNFTSVSNCANPGTPTPVTVTATSLVPGQTYHVMIDGFSGDVCDFTINVTDGNIATVGGGPPMIPAPASPDQPMSARALRSHTPCRQALAFPILTGRLRRLSALLSITETTRSL